MTKIPVKDLYTACGMMLREKWGYIYGTAGEMWSAEKQAKYKAKYEGDSKREMSCKYGGKWAGYMVSDCAGVMVYIWRRHGLSIYHGSNTIRRKYCGPLQKTPVPGYAALKLRDGDDFYHIGIVAEDGMNVYEARGAQAGFVKSAASSWNGGFAPFLDVDYSGETEHTEQQGGDQVVWQGVVETENGRLNVRSGPGLEYAVIGALPKDEEVDVFKEKNGWAYIAGDGLNGWVSMQYLKPVKAEPPAEENLWGVLIPCDSEEEAQRYAENFKGAMVLKCKKPDA